MLRATTLLTAAAMLSAGVGEIWAGPVQVSAIVVPPISVDSHPFDEGPSVASGDLDAGATLHLNGGVSTLAGGVRQGGPPADDLIGYWAFGDGTGNTAVNEASPGDKDGTLTNFRTDDSQWIDGVVGGGLSFDGADDFVNIAGYRGVPDASPRTVAAWIKTTSDNAPIVSWGNNSGGQKWTFRTQTSNGRAGAVRVEINGGYIVGNTDIRDNLWHHVAAVLPPGVNNVDGVLLYVDGQPEWISAVKRRALDTEAGANVRIGLDFNNRYFPGRMDEVLLYDRALGAAEVDLLWGNGSGLPPGPVVLDASRSNVTVTDTSELTATADEVIFADLLVQNPGGGNPPMTLTLSDAHYTFNNLTAEDGATIAGDFAVEGTLAPGNSPGTLYVDGALEFGDTATYVCEIDVAGDRIISIGDPHLHLAGTLAVEVLGVDPAEIGTDTMRRIVNVTGEGVIFGQFAPVPAGHLGLGVFNRGVDYVQTIPQVPPPEGPAYASVDLQMYVATGGDANGDGRVDDQDVANLIANFSRQGDLPDRDWPRSDTAGGSDGRGDGNVDGRDINDLISQFTDNPGTAEPGTAGAEYNPVTNEWLVSVEGVMSWALIGDGRFLGSEVAGVYDRLPLGGAPNLVSANANTVGEGSFDAPMTYVDVRLGQLTEPGADVGQVTLEYVSRFGGERTLGTITVVPEPSTLILLTTGALALIVYRRRRQLCS